MLELNTVTLEGLHFKKPGKGGGYRAPLPFEPEVDATFKGWDAETRTLSYTTPGEGEDADPVEHSRVISNAEIAAGIDFLNTPLPVPVPVKVTKRQMRIALLKAGLDVDAQIAALPAGEDRAILEIEWQHADYIHRRHPMVEQLAASLGMTAEQTDDLFRAAAAVPTEFN